MSFKEKAGNLIFNSHVEEGTGFRDRRIRPLNPGVIVVSRSTAREIVREDYARTVWHMAMVKTEPDRCYGIRVAYDESMALGEMLVGETHGGPK